MSSKQKVFLCHNSNDKNEVRKIRYFLENRGLKTFMDQYDFRTFEFWKKQLEKEIKNFKVAAIFIGKSGLGSWQTKEIEMFIKELEQEEKQDNKPDRRRIGLVILPGCTDELLRDVKTQWKALDERQWTDFNQEEPDPIEQLIFGITHRKTSSKLTRNEILTIHRKNRELRAELFKVVADEFQKKVESLHRVIELEKSRIRTIDKELSKLILDLEENLETTLKQGAKVFRAHIQIFARKSSQFALMNFIEYQHEPKSVKFQKELNWFQTEIEKYLGRIHISLVTSRDNILYEQMEHKSGFDSKIYAKALNRVKDIVLDFQFTPDFCEEIRKRIDLLVKIINHR